jgi:hypothetical protein
MQDIAWLARYRHRPWLFAMLKLPMTPSLPDDFPTIIFQLPQDLSYFHDH